MPDPSTSTINHQCFLLAKADEIRRHKVASRSGGGHGPGDAWIAMQDAMRVGIFQLPCPDLGVCIPAGAGAPFDSNLEFINKITSLKKIKSFFEITPAQVAQLAHYAKISINVYDKNGKYLPEPSKTMPFNNWTNLGKEGSILQGSAQRKDAGIQNINVSFEGVDSATKKIILVDVTYLFQDIRTATKEPYTGLFEIGIHTGKKNYRYIEFEIGWTTSNNVKIGLEHLKLKLKTHLVKYTFDLKEDGSIVINAQYRGHMTDVFDGPSSNILSLAKSTAAQLKNNLTLIDSHALGQTQIALKNAKDEEVTLLALTIIDQAMASVLDVAQHSRKFDTEQRRLLYRLKHVKYEQYAKLAKLLYDIRAARTPNPQRGRGVLHPPIPGAYGPKVHEFTQAQNWAAKKKIHLWFRARVRGAKSSVRISLSKVTTARKDAITSANKAALLAKYLTLRTIAEKLVDNKTIQYAYIEREKIIELNAQASAGNKETTRNIMNSITDFDVRPDKIDEGDTLNKEKLEVVPYIFFGDLLAQLISLPASPHSKEPIWKLITNDTGEKFRIDFGYVSYSAPYSGNKIDNFQLYWLPISLVKLNNFFAREIVGKEKEFFSLDDFIRKILREFFTSHFSICNREIKVGDKFIPPKIDFVTGVYKPKSKKERSSLSYFIYGSKNVMHDIKNIKFGNYASNLKNNIYHFYLGGQNRGAVKSVKLIDIADASVKTAVYYKDGVSQVENIEGTAAKEGIWAPVVFQADIETIGFPLYNLGQLIYIDLRPYITIKNLRQFKANGYYAVKKIQHTFTAETFSSKINAIIEYSQKEHDEAKKPAAGTPAQPSNLGAKQQRALNQAVKKVQKYKQTIDLTVELLEADGILDEWHKKRYSNSGLSQHSPYDEVDKVADKYKKFKKKKNP